MHEFGCRFCGWRGTQPVLDAHLHAWCPACGKPADFAVLLEPHRGDDR